MKSFAGLYLYLIRRSPPLSKVLRIFQTSITQFIYQFFLRIDEAGRDWRKNQLKLKCDIKSDLKSTILAFNGIRCPT